MAAPEGRVMAEHDEERLSQLIGYHALGGGPVSEMMEKVARDYAEHYARQERERVSALLDAARGFRAVHRIDDGEAHDVRLVFEAGERLCAALDEYEGD